MLRRVAWVLCSLVALGGPRLAHAHHPSGGARNNGAVNLVGGGPGRAQTRFFLLGEYTRGSQADSPTGSSTDRLTVSAISQVAVHPWFSVGVQAPLTVLAGDGSNAIKVGYDDTRVTARLTPHADEGRNRVVTIGVEASFPTRTFRLQTDPGRAWGVAPSVTYTRSYDRLYWLTFASLPVESRPAGTAFDVSLAAQLGYRLFQRRPLTPALGLLMDTRYLTVCQLSDGGSKVCPRGRVTERDRPLGAVRLYAQAAVLWTVATFGRGDTRSLDLYAAGQLALTKRRDFDGGASLGLMLRL